MRLILGQAGGFYECVLFEAPEITSLDQSRAHERKPGHLVYFREKSEAVALATQDDFNRKGAGY
jgi:hypothetical protein